MAQNTTPMYTADDQLDFCRDLDVAARGDSREGLLAWLEKERPHLLRAYDADFLVQAMESSRVRQQAGR